MKKSLGVFMVSALSIVLAGSIVTSMAIVNKRHFGDNGYADAIKICDGLGDKNASHVITCTYKEYVTEDVSRNISAFLSKLEWKEDKTFSSSFVNFNDFDETIKIRIGYLLKEYNFRINEDFSKCAIQSNVLLSQKDVRIYDFKKENGLKLVNMIIEGSKEYEL